MDNISCYTELRPEVNDPLALEETTMETGEEGKTLSKSELKQLCKKWSNRRKNQKTKRLRTKKKKSHSQW